jgi:hypothetical protein
MTPLEQIAARVTYGVISDHPLDDEALIAALDRYVKQANADIAALLAVAEAAEALLEETIQRDGYERAWYCRICKVGYDIEKATHLDWCPVDALRAALEAAG